jgi:hypothetical protein
MNRSMNNSPRVLSVTGRTATQSGPARRPPRWRATAKALRSDEGAATAEYAIATMAAVGFAGLLVVIMRGDEVREMLTDLVRRALTFEG